MRILSVVGTRPQLIKAAVLSPVLRRRHDEILVDTGQHYDDALAGTFFRELDLSRPERGLGIGSGSHAQQTSQMLLGLETVMLETRPDRVLVYGDTNSTLAGALAAAKLGLPLAHVEAGLRSFDRRMPEEINRVVADHLATWLFAPTPSAVEHLAAEGITTGVHLVGDLMQDLAARVAPGLTEARVLDGVSAELAELAEVAESPAPGDARQRVELRPGGFLLVTIHRAENREPAAVREWAGLLNAVADPRRPILFPIHPGTRVVLEQAGVSLGPDVVRLPPLGYATTLALELHAAAVLTDSGGVQRETGWLGTPCLVLRKSTEWTEQVAASGGRMRCVGRDRDAAAAALDELAPFDRAPDLARVRASTLDLRPAGAADAILTHLEAPPAEP
jgi:UDP-GlcNAc3NAcA epimerase